MHTSLTFCIRFTLLTLAKGLAGLRLRGEAERREKGACEIIFVWLNWALSIM